MRTRKPDFLHVTGGIRLGSFATVDVLRLKLVAPFVERDAMTEPADMAHPRRRLRKAPATRDPYGRYCVPVTPMPTLDVNH